MNITPLTSTDFAAEVNSFDAGQFDPPSFRLLYSTWLKYGVIRLRNQKLTTTQLMQFSQEFGPLEFSPMGKVTAAQRARVKNPHVLTISNIQIEGKPIGGLGAGETSWHTDMSYVTHPPTASLLYAIEVPKNGGDTQFCCMGAAYSSLPQDLRERCHTLEIKHDAAHDSIGKLRNGYNHAANPKVAPGVFHPAVVNHPETGQTVLYLGRRSDAYIKGLSIPANEDLLDEIWQYVAMPTHTWTQHWQVGDLLIWDNRRLMHKRTAFSDQDRRLMRRTQVQSTQQPSKADEN